MSGQPRPIPPVPAVLVQLRTEITQLLNVVWMIKVQQKAFHQAFPKVPKLPGECPARGLLTCLHQSVFAVKAGQLENAAIQALITRLNTARDTLKFAADTITKTKTQRSQRFISKPRRRVV
jgi:hypothetical protein